MHNIQICNEVNIPVKQEVTTVKNEIEYKKDGQKTSLSNLKANVYTPYSFNIQNMITTNTFPLPHREKYNLINRLKSQVANFESSQHLIQNMPFSEKQFKTEVSHDRIFRPFLLTSKELKSRERSKSGELSSGSFEDDVSEADSMDFENETELLAEDLSMKHNDSEVSSTSNDSMELLRYRYRLASHKLPNYKI